MAMLGKMGCQVFHGNIFYSLCQESCFFCFHLSYVERKSQRSFHTAAWKRQYSALYLKSGYDFLDVSCCQTSVLSFNWCGMFRKVVC
jgi:hypothetical protein